MHRRLNARPQAAWRCLPTVGIARISSALTRLTSWCGRFLWGDWWGVNFKYDLAQAYIQRAGLRHYALPAMRRLAASTSETVFLGKIEPKGVRIIESMVDEGAQPALHISAPRGTRVHLLAAATGPFVLASWPLAQREAFLQAHALPRFTEHTITDPQQFLARVEEAVRTGVSFDHEEYLVGVNAVGAPIYGTGGSLVALLWVVGFASRFKGEAL